MELENESSWDVLKKKKTNQNKKNIIRTLLIVVLSNLIFYYLMNSEPTNICVEEKSQTKIPKDFIKVRLPLISYLSSDQQSHAWLYSKNNSFLNIEAYILAKKESEDFEHYEVLIPKKKSGLLSHLSFPLKAFPYYQRRKKSRSKNYEITY